MTKASTKTKSETAEDAIPAEQAPWKADDYVGPLTAPQAAWRNRHIKRVEQETKPKREVATK